MTQNRTIVGYESDGTPRYYGDSVAAVRRELEQRQALETPKPPRGSSSLKALVGWALLDCGAVALMLLCGAPFWAIVIAMVWNISGFIEGRTRGIA